MEDLCATHSLSDLRMPRNLQALQGTKYLRALHEFADLCMVQVYDSRGSSSSGGGSEMSLNRSGSGRVSLDHWVSR